MDHCDCRCQAPHATDSRIRFMVKADEPAVLAIERASFAAPWTPGELSTAVRRANTVGLVALDDRKRPIGFVVYEFAGAALRIVRLAVHPDHRRAGVGKLLAAHLAGKLSRNRRTRLTAVVPESNLAACHFLAGCGFQATEVLRDYFGTEDGYSFSLYHSIAAVTLPAGAIA